MPHGLCAPFAQPMLVPTIDREFNQDSSFGDYSYLVQGIQLDKRSQTMKSRLTPPIQLFTLPDWLTLLREGRDTFLDILSLRDEDVLLLLVGRCILWRDVPPDIYDPFDGFHS